LKEFTQYYLARLLCPLLIILIAFIAPTFQNIVTCPLIFGQTSKAQKRHPEPVINKIIRYRVSNIANVTQILSNSQRSYSLIQLELIE